MPTLHAVGGIATPALAPGAGRDFMVEIPPSSSVLAPGRPCLRSVPAHRIVGGGLGRRYDQAARLSDRHYACDRQRRSSLWVPPATSSLGGGLTGSSSWAGPLLDGVRALAFPRDNNAAEELAPPAAAAAAGDADLHRIGGDGPELQPQVVAAGAVLGQVIPVVDLSHRLPDGRNNIGMLTSLCLEAMVNSWESVCGNYLYLPRAYHMPHELCARLLRLLITSRKLTAFTLSGFLNPAALELDLSGCSFVPKSVFKQLGFSCPRIVHLNLSMCTQVNNAIVRCVLQGCSALRQLYLDGCRHVTDAGFHLQQSPFYVLLGAVSLETISVQGCPQVTGELVLHLRKICRNLKELDLARCKSVSSASVGRVFDSCPSLESLNVSFLDVVDEAFEGINAIDLVAVEGDAAFASGGQRILLDQADEERGSLSRTPARPLAGSPSLPALRHLNLGRCAGVTDLALARIGGGFPGLEGVHLEHCLRVTDVGVRALAAGCRELRALGLGNCGQITDRALEALSVHCPSLEWLDCSWCGDVTDKGFALLAEGCPGLEEVQAAWCENLTDAALSALSKSCLRLEALHIGGCVGVTDAAVAELRVAGVEVFQ
ncbi:unnamed protein product [Ascophyllum nodosum]